MITAIVSVFVIVQIQALMYTVYVHRYKSHNSISLHPIFEKFCLLLIWLTTVQISNPWWIKKSVARHRKHHAHADTVYDPHSPQFFKLSELLSWKKSTTKNGCYYISDDDIQKYAKDVPLETSWFLKFPPYFGILLSSIFLFFYIGFWSLIPIWFLFNVDKINGILNVYLVHKFGYKHKESKHKAKNCWPIAILAGGEELHANHHEHPNKANYSLRWYEFDLGYTIIKLLSFTGLVKILDK